MVSRLDGLRRLIRGCLSCFRFARWFVQRSLGFISLRFFWPLGRQHFGRRAHHGTNRFRFCQSFTTTLFQLTCTLVFRFFTGFAIRFQFSLCRCSRSFCLRFTLSRRFFFFSTLRTCSCFTFFTICTRTVNSRCLRLSAGTRLRTRL